MISTFPHTQSEDISLMYSTVLERTIKEYEDASSKARKRVFNPTDEEVKNWQAKHLNKTEKANLAKARELLEQARKDIASFRAKAVDALTPADEDEKEAKDNLRITKRKLKGRVETLKSVAEDEGDQAVIEWADKVIKTLSTPVANPTTKKVRDWLRDNHHPVGEKGRIPDELMRLVPDELK